MPRRPPWILALALLAGLGGSGVALADVSFTPAPGSPYERSTAGATTDPSRLAVLPIDPGATPDVVVSDPASLMSYLAPGTAAGSFTFGGSTTASSSPSAVVAVDAQADGDLDLVRLTRTEVQTFLANGTDGFAAGLPSDATGGFFTAGLAAGRLDGDALPDLAVGVNSQSKDRSRRSGESGAIAIMPGTVRGRFGPGTANTVPRMVAVPGQSYVADVVLGRSAPRGRS